MLNIMNRYEYIGFVERERERESMLMPKNG